MRDRCERCGQRLRADGEAAICSFEGIFCPACAEALQGSCPNCAGELVPRPRRTRPVASAAAGSLVRRFTGQR